MESKKSRFRIHWFWGFVGCCGSLGLILGEPGYYALLLVLPVLRGTPCQST